MPSVDATTQRNSGGLIGAAGRSTKHQFVSRRIAQLFDQKIYPRRNVNVVLVEYVVIAIPVITKFGPIAVTWGPCVEVPPTLEMAVEGKFPAQSRCDLLHDLRCFQALQVCY